MVRKFTTVGLTLLPLLGMLTGCPKKEPVVVDAGAPAPVATPAATVEDLKPMDTEDAGPDTGVDAGKKPGVAGNPNVARLKACCNQLAAEGKRMGAGSAEGGMIIAAAAQCNAMAAQAGTSGNAAEMGVIRNLLQGRNVPPVCGGF
ncbi:MAG: hypothetical protein U0174_05420 [Polyangiaceae bacterium]